MKEVAPKLFFNTSSEDREAVYELLKAGVHCDLAGPIAEEHTPLLIYGSMSFYGLDGIREFIKRWEKDSSISTDGSLRITLHVMGDT